MAAQRRGEGELGRPLPLELTDPAAQALLEEVVARCVAYLGDLPRSPAFDHVDAAALAAALDEPMPEEGAPAGPVLDHLFGRIIPTGVNPASAGSLSYVNGGGLVHVSAAGLIAAITNRFGGFWAAAPGVNEVEALTVRWLCALMGYPPGAGGLLTTGGSMSNLTALLTARVERLVGPLERATVYVSEDMHHSVERAAFVVGVPWENVRKIAVDADGAVRVDAVAARIAQDRAEGFAPFCLVATAGTTSLGAVDDLAELAALADREGLWFHVDAAYGGFFQLTSRGRAVLSGIELADSITLDPHKSLFFPFGTGCLLVRDGDALRRAHQCRSACVLDIAEEGSREGRWNFADLSVEQTREARGLKVWLPLKLCGAAAFRAALEEKLDLAAHAASRIARVAGLELVTSPRLSTFAFRVAVGPPDATARLVDAVNRDGAVHLTTATVRGVEVARFCVISFRTHASTVDRAVQLIADAAAELGRSPTPWSAHD